jgi:hypothetical protein
MKKLYAVDVQHTVYVMAEDPQEAERTARHGIREYHDEPICSVSEVKNGPIDPDWREVVPYGAEDERTVSQIMNAAKSAH